MSMNPAWNNIRDGFTCQDCKNTGNFVSVKTRAWRLVDHSPDGPFYFNIFSVDNCKPRFRFLLPDEDSVDQFLFVKRRFALLQIHAEIFYALYTA
jgi:hypothetical protein